MGLYINPPTEISKSEWLLKEARPSNMAEVRSFQFTPMVKELPLVLVDNGHFDALGIMFNSRERDSWLRSFDDGDDRPHSFWFVAVEKIKEFHPNHPYLAIFIGEKK
jgi:hypothetical protein